MISVLVGCNSSLSFYLISGEFIYTQFVGPQTRSLFNHKQPTTMSSPMRAAPQSAGTLTRLEISPEPEEDASPQQTTHPLGEELDIAKLILLKEQFSLLDGDGSGQLSMEEFVAAFDLVFQKGLSREQSVRLFMQIDADEGFTLISCAE